MIMIIIPSQPLTTILYNVARCHCQLHHYDQITQQFLNNDTHMYDSPCFCITECDLVEASYE